MLTAYPSFENAMEAIQHQVDEFFTKPADVNTLVKITKDKLEARRSRVPVGLTAGLMKLTKGLNAFMIAALQPYAQAQPASRPASRRSTK